MIDTQRTPCADTTIPLLHHHMTSITELQNENTGDLDIMDSQGIIQLLRQSDAQLFCGYRNYPSLYDKATLTTLVELIQACVSAFALTAGTGSGSSSGSSSSGSSNKEDAEMKTDGEGARRRRVTVVLSGAGTSGRMAYFVARAFNRLFPGEAYFHYLIAGGDKALIVGQEGSEDDTTAAVSDLKLKLAKGNEGDTVVYVGITCGLSAPYVAAQLDYLFSLADSGKAKVVSVLMGFNPVELARKNVIEHWDKSFFAVASEMEKRSTPTSDSSWFVVNPVVGPEPLTGSTRMKGGTVTKLLLEVIFAVVYNISFAIPLCSLAKDDFSAFAENTSASITVVLCRLFGHYERTCRATYIKTDELAPLVQLSGKSLKAQEHPETKNLSQGHVYYLAGSTLGLLAFIDASETVPTFGASYKEDAWSILGNEEGDLSSFGPQYTISQAFFEQTISPTIDERDFVVLFYNAAEPHNSNTKLAIVYFDTKPSRAEHTTDRDAAFNLADVVIVMDLPFSELLPGMPSFTEVSTKWILNAISTGGFVLQGKVYQNRMIDLGITNNKLYHRACGIISKFGQVDLATATQNLLRAIYSLDPAVPVPSSVLSAPVSDHVIKASHGASKVVATALLLCNSFTIADAKLALAADPVVRNIIINNGIGKQ